MEEDASGSAGEQSFCAFAFGDVSSDFEALADSAGADDGDGGGAVGVGVEDVVVETHNFGSPRTAHVWFAVAVSTVLLTSHPKATSQCVCIRVLTTSIGVVKNQRCLLETAG